MACNVAGITTRSIAMVGRSVVVLYRGQDATEPREYRGTVETVKVPKTAPQNGPMAVVKLVDGTYRSFYINQALRFETV